MKPSHVAVMLILTAMAINGCSSRGSRSGNGSEDGSERDRNDNAFTVQNSSDWGDAAGRVVNHLTGAAPPRGGIWPVHENQ